MQQTTFFGFYLHLYCHIKMFIPDHLYHDVPNPFYLYGFRYESIAHWLVIQSQAKKGYAFKQYFDMPIDKLPRIVQVNRDVLEEGLQQMLPNMKAKDYKYAHSHSILGIGTTKFRMRFGDDANGLDVYGQCFTSVLKRREDLK